MHYQDGSFMIMMHFIATIIGKHISYHLYCKCSNVLHNFSYILPPPKTATQLTNVSAVKPQISVSTHTSLSFLRWSSNFLGFPEISSWLIGRFIYFFFAIMWLAFILKRLNLQKDWLYYQILNLVFKCQVNKDQFYLLI